MTDRFSTMLRRKLTVDWANKTGPLDLRNHSLGIGGVHSMPAPKPVIEGTAALKPKIIRIFLQEFFFIYLGQGKYDWTKMDAYMDAVHAMGADIMASICIKPKALYPVVDEKIWKPTDIKEWQEVIRAMVLRYSEEKPYVSHWAIANEQNIGEWGGCPYLITDPDEYFEYYKITAEPILALLPDLKGDVKIGGPSYAGGGESAAKYLGRFVELCKKNNIRLDFTCHNMYHDDPEDHRSFTRVIRDELDRHDPSVELYMTEFNVGIGNEMSLEDKAYDPKRAASLGASILTLHEDQCLTGTFQYHLYDQWNDPREFSPWYAKSRYMAEHWNDIGHRLGLFDLDGKTRPQYFVYDMLYSMTGQQIGLLGTDKVLRGIASSSDDGTMSVFLTNFAVHGTPDAVTQFKFENATDGVYRMNVYRIDNEMAAYMKAASYTKIPTTTSTASYQIPMLRLPPVESRTTYVHSDFHFDVFTPADSVTLVQFTKGV